MTDSESKKTILVLEPQWDFAETIAELLRSAGYHAVVATSISEGARHARDGPVDVVVADSQFGLDRRALPPPLVGTPVIHTAASSPPKPGARWISKPFSRAQLIAVLLGALEDTGGD